MFYNILWQPRKNKHQTYYSISHYQGWVTKNNLLKGNITTGDTPHFNSINHFLWEEGMVQHEKIRLKIWKERLFFAFGMWLGINLRYEFPPIVDDAEIPTNHRLDVKNSANNGMNYQPQVISRISEPSTASTWPTNVLLFLKNLHPQKSERLEPENGRIQRRFRDWIFRRIFSFQSLVFGRVYKINLHAFFKCYLPEN